MIRDIVPWGRLTRGGTNIPPSWRVIRRPLTANSVTHPVGAIIASDLFDAWIARTRLRQFYQARLLEPEVAPAGTRQAARQQPRPQPEPEMAMASSIVSEGLGELPEVGAGTVKRERARRVR